MVNICHLKLKWCTSDWELCGRSRLTDKTTSGVEVSQRFKPIKVDGRDMF